MSQDINITISLDSGAPPNPAPAKKPPSLQERVDYAIECIVCGEKKDKAIAFLQKAHSVLDAKPRQTRKDQVLLELIRTAISDYGHYHIQPRKPAEGEK